jgi:hypothetical protein
MTTTRPQSKTTLCYSMQSIHTHNKQIHSFPHQTYYEKAEKHRQLGGGAVSIDGGNADAAAASTPMPPVAALCFKQHKVSQCVVYTYMCVLYMASDL